MKDLDPGTLDLLREDAVKVAAKISKPEPAGPKAKYGGPSSDYTSALEDTRERLYGFRRGDDGQVI